MTFAKSRVFVLGLDGATFSLIRPWAQAGYLPSFQRLLANGTSAILNSTFPPKTASAWLSLATGLNPGQHGVFDFINYDVRSYTFFEKQMVKGGPRAQGRTLWDVVGQQGGKVAAIGVPMTYPVWPVNGVMIGENVLVDIEQQAYPLDRAKSWAEGYLSLPSFYRLMRTAPDRFAEESLLLAERRLQILQEVLSQDLFQFVMIVLDEPDRSQHCYWKHMGDKTSSLQDTILKHYRVCDTALALLLEHMDENTSLFIVSDHGGGAAPGKYVNFNVALQQAGLLRRHQTTASVSPDRFVKSLVCCLREAVYQRFSHHEIMRLKGMLPRRVKNFFTDVSQNTNLIDWPQTSAYRFEMHPPSEGVMVNLRERQSAGAVRPEDYARVRQDVVAALKDLTDPQTGKRIIREIRLREEAYWGEHIQDAPDIVMLLADGYRGGNGLDELISEVPETTLDFWNGEHRMEGVFLAYGDKIRPGTNLPPLSPESLAPSALYAAGLAASPSMRGQVVNNAFSSSYLTTAPLSALPPPKELVLHPSEQVMERAPMTSSLSSQEEQALVERLRGLGYLE